MRCWNCQKELEDPFHKLSFKATCDFCQAWLHCCQNCRFYQVGQPNDCLIPGTEQIADRQTANYCEEFSLRKSEQAPSQASAEEIERRLFGENNLPKKQDFNSLFD